MANENSIKRMEKTVSKLKEDLAAIRTGRASAAIFDKVRVNCYGEQTPLSQVASISIPEARQVVVTPWDKTLLGEIEKAIQKSDLGLNPANDGKIIRIAIPPLTAERRKELAKQAKAVAEASKTAIRNIRRDGNDEIKKMQKDGVDGVKLTEDEAKSAESDLQKSTDNFVKEIEKILSEKEKEITEG